MSKNYAHYKKAGFILVLLMVLLQGFYGVFSLLDPAAFSVLRGTELFANRDADWVMIYGSRTLFIALVLGYLLYSGNYVVLLWCSLFGLVMPITDGILAYQAQAPFNVVLKHLATAVYLLLTCVVLKQLLPGKEGEHG